MKPTRRSRGGRGCQAAHWGVLQSHYGENCQLEGAGLEPRANVYPTIAVLQRQEGIRFSRFPAVPTKTHARQHVHSAIFKMDSQQGQGTLLNEAYQAVMWQPGWERSLGKEYDIYICISESLCCAPETITKLLICYTPI